MRRLMLSVAVMLVLLSVMLTGCAGGEMSEADIQKTVEEIVTTNYEVETSTFDLSMEAEIDVEGGEDVSVALVGTGTGVTDSVNRQMHMVMNMTVSTPEQDTIDMPVEYFLVDGWMYMKVSVPEQEEQWLKMEMPDDMWEKQNQAQQQIEMLQTAEEVNFLGIEEVNGVECYVVEIIPDLSALQQMISQVQGQMSQFGNVDLSAMDLGRMLKQVSVTQYVAMDSYLFMRTDQHMVMEITPEAMGLPDDEFDRITEDVTTVLLFRDYNEPVTIQLPQGALAAVQMGGQEKTRFLRGGLEGTGLSRLPPLPACRQLMTGDIRDE